MAFAALCVILFLCSPAAGYVIGALWVLAMAFGVVLTALAVAAHPWPLVQVCVALGVGLTALDVADRWERRARSW